MVYITQSRWPKHTFVYPQNIPSNFFRTCFKGRSMQAQGQCQMLLQLLALSCMPNRCQCSQPHVCSSTWAFNHKECAVAPANNQKLYADRCTIKMLQLSEFLGVFVTIASHTPEMMSRVAPASRSFFAHSFLPLRRARKRGVRPSMFLESIFAPYLIRASRHLECCKFKD